MIQFAFLFCHRVDQPEVMEESSGESSEDEDHPAAAAGMSVLLIGVLDLNNISLFCINANILNLYTVILDIISQTV